LFYFYLNLLRLKVKLYYLILSFLYELFYGGVLELTLRKVDFNAMKQQAESTNREYDRLLDEHSKLQVSHLMLFLKVFSCQCAFILQSQKFTKCDDLFGCG